MTEHLSFEELKVACGGFFSDDVLKNFYDVCTGEPWYKVCGECGLQETVRNSHLFYESKTTDCISCSLARSRRNNTVRRLKRLAERERKKKLQATSSAVL